jgi:hypothetical protein
MKRADIQPHWSVSKANAAQLAIIFAMAWIASAAMQIAPVWSFWSALPFVTALVFGSWWGYRWLGDRNLAKRSHTFHYARQNTPQTHLQPARTTPTKKPTLYVPESPERL